MNIVKPVRCKIIALDRLDSDDAKDPTALPVEMEVFANPDMLAMTTEAKWQKFDIPGLSHEVLQYTNTGSTTTSIQLWYSVAADVYRQAAKSPLPENPNGGRNVQLNREQEIVQRMNTYRNFLYSFVYPMERGRAPSRMLFSWPNAYRSVCVCTRIAFEITDFSSTGVPMVFTCTMELTEVRTSFRQANGANRNFFDIDDQDSNQLQYPPGGKKK